MADDAVAAEPLPAHGESPVPLIMGPPYNWAVGCLLQGASHVCVLGWPTPACSVSSTMCHCWSHLQRMAQAAQPCHLTDWSRVGPHGTFIRVRLQQLTLQLSIPGGMDSCLRWAGQQVQTSCASIWRLAQDRAACSADLNQPVGSKALLGPCCRSTQMGTVGHCVSAIC